MHLILVVRGDGRRQKWLQRFYRGWQSMELPVKIIRNRKITGWVDEILGVVWYGFWQCLWDLQKCLPGHWKHASGADEKSGLEIEVINSESKIRVLDSCEFWKGLTYTQPLPSNPTQLSHMSNELGVHIFPMFRTRLRINLSQEKWRVRSSQLPGCWLRQYLYVSFSLLVLRAPAHSLHCYCPCPAALTQPPLVSTSC